MAAPVQAWGGQAVVPFRRPAALIAINAKTARIGRMGAH
jgi:hypothetical protein